MEKFNFTVNAKAFAEIKRAVAEAKKYGFFYVSSFTSLTKASFRSCKDLYFCNDWTEYRSNKTHSKGVSLTHSSAGIRYNLPEDWKKFVYALKNGPRIPIEVALNRNYTAIVSDTNIKVGCQTFTFDKVKELYTAVIKTEKLLKKVV